MNNVKLSYVLTTYNKLPYLKEVIKRLVENCQIDEEIIVTDGGSTDGSYEYLNALYEKNIIDQFISEKDFGEAHGFNKGILMAKGELIKLMSDDDVFDFDIMKQCKAYMMSNKSIDVLYANVASIISTSSSANLVFAKSYEEWFIKWSKKETKNCFLCGLSLFMRKRALPYIGLLDSSFKHVDFEHSVRLTSKKVNVAFCTGLLVCAIINTNSISYVSGDEVHNEIKRVSGYYDYIYPVGSIPSTDKISNQSFFKKILSILKSDKEIAPKFYPEYNFVLEENMETTLFGALFAKLGDLMNQYNQSHKVEFVENIKY